MERLNINFLRLGVCWNKPKVDRPELIPVDRPIPADRPQLIQEDRPEKECKKPECRSHSGTERNVMNRKIRSRLEKDFERSRQHNMMNCSCIH